MRGNFTSFNPIKQAASSLITAAKAKKKKGNLNMMVTTEESHTQMRCDVCDV